jgi:hypothetical protein
LLNTSIHFLDPKLNRHTEKVAMKRFSLVSVLSTFILPLIFLSAIFVVAAPIIKGKAIDFSILEESQIDRKLKKGKKKKKKTKSSKSSKETGDTLCADQSQEDALLAFKAGITGDPKNSIANWVAGGSVCNGNTSNWSGITCVSDQVTKLDLGT